MTHIRATGVTVLIHQPLELGRIRVSSADVLRLQMLQLTVDVVTFAHLLVPMSSTRALLFSEFIRVFEILFFY